MILTELIDFTVGTGLFIRAIFKAIVDYIRDNKLPNVCNPEKSAKVPESLPSIVDIKRALPRKCFEPHVSTSLYYFAKDVAQIIIAYVLMSFLDQRTTSYVLRVPLVLLYWAFQGTFFMGLFILGHDCGHGSFSKYSLLNDAVGTICHCSLLVPYYQWKLSHRNHHKNTCNIDHDEVFYPVRQSQHHLAAFNLPGFALGIGFYKYLFSGYNPRPVKHYSASEPMFLGHFVGCLLSLLTVLVFVYLAVLYSMNYGLMSLITYYVVPLLILGSYVVVLTFLQHCDEGIIWYADSQWDYVRGQLSTVDRNFGIVHDVIHCASTHQIHHMFPKIPHYHLEEASAHFRQAFPHLARSRDEPIMRSFVRMFQKFDRQSVIADNAETFILE